MISKWAILVTYVILSACDCLYVETLTKCPIGDDKCVLDLITKIIKDTSDSGNADMNVPPLDPLSLKNISVSIVGFFNLTMEEGQLKGVKDCEINSLHNDFEKGVTNLQVTCDLTLKGKLNVSETSPFLQTFLGSEPIKFDGFVKIKIEKLVMKMQFFYHFIKNDDGEVYFKCHLDEFKYDYEVGKAQLKADKIYLKGQEASKLAVDLFNENWKFLLQTFGRNIFDVAMPIFQDILHIFIDTVPAKNYISGDLTPFVKNV